MGGNNRYLEDDDESDESSISSQVGDIHEIVRTASLLDIKKAISIDRPRLLALKDDLDRVVLHCAALGGRVKVALYLISKNADVNAKDNKNQTPLHLAASQGHTNMCRFLLDFNANLGMKDVDGWTALHHAVYGNFYDTAILLLKRGVNAAAQDFKFGRTALHLAAECGYANLVNMLIIRGSKLVGANDELFEKSALHYACERNNIDVIKVLLQHGANPNLLGGLLDRAPLHVTAEKGFYEASQILIQYGADINMIGANTNGYSPLHVACEANQFMIVELLLQFGANINLPGKYTILGKSPLHIACQASNLQIVHLLCGQALATTSSSGSVQRNNMTSSASTSSQSATGSGHSSQLVTQTHNASTTSVSSVITAPDISRALDMNSQDVHGHTPLHIACILGFYDIAIMLLDYGANANITSYAHRYAIDYVTQPTLKFQMEQIVAVKLRQSIQHKVTEKYQSQIADQEQIRNKQRDIMQKQKELEELEYLEMQRQKFMKLIISLVTSSGEVNALEMLWEGVIEGRYKESYINEKLFIYENNNARSKHDRFTTLPKQQHKYRPKDGLATSNFVSSQGEEMIGSNVMTIYNNPSYTREPMQTITGGLLDEGIYSGGSILSIEGNVPFNTLSPRKLPTAKESSLLLFNSTMENSQTMVPYLNDSAMSQQNSILLLGNGPLEGDGGSMILFDGGGIPVGIGNPLNYYTYAIIHASMQGYFSLVEAMLVWPGMEIDIQDTEGNTALHYAASNTHIDVVELLLFNNASNTVFNKAGKLAANMTKTLFLQDIIRNPDKVKKKYQYQAMVAGQLQIHNTEESNSKTLTSKSWTLSTKVKEKNVYDSIIAPAAASTAPASSHLPLTISTKTDRLPTSIANNTTEKTALATSTMDEVIQSKYNLLITKEIVSHNEMQYNPVKSNPSIAARMIQSGQAMLPPIHSATFANALATAETSRPNSSGMNSRPRTGASMNGASNNDAVVALPSIHATSTMSGKINHCGTGDHSNLNMIDPVLLDKYGPLPNSYIPHDPNQYDFFQLPPAPTAPATENANTATNPAIAQQHAMKQLNQPYTARSNSNDSLTAISTHGTSVSYFTYLSQKKSHYFQDVYTLQQEYPPSCFDDTKEYLDVKDTLWLAGYPYYYYYLHVYTNIGNTSQQQSSSGHHTHHINNMIERLYLEKIISKNPTHHDESLGSTSFTLHHHGMTIRPIERYDMRILGYQMSKLLAYIQMLYCTPASLMMYPSYIPSSVTAATQFAPPPFGHAALPTSTKSPSKSTQSSQQKQQLQEQQKQQQRSHLQSEIGTNRYVNLSAPRRQKKPKSQSLWKHIQPQDDEVPSTIREYTEEEMLKTEDQLFTIYRTLFPKNIHLLDVWRMEWYGQCCFEYVTLYLASYEYDSVVHLLDYYELQLPSFQKFADTMSTQTPSEPHEESKKQSVVDDTNSVQSDVGSGGSVLAAESSLLSTSQWPVTEGVLPGSTAGDEHSTDPSQQQPTKKEPLLQWGSIFMTKLFIYWFCQPQSHTTATGAPITHNTKPPLPTSSTNTTMTKEEYTAILQFSLAYSELLYHYLVLLDTMIERHALSPAVHDQLKQLIQLCGLLRVDKYHHPFHFSAQSVAAGHYAGLSETIDAATATDGDNDNDSVQSSLSGQSTHSSSPSKKHAKKSTSKTDNNEEEEEEKGLFPDPLQTCWSGLILNPPRSLRNTMDLVFELSHAMVKYYEHYYSQDIIRTHLWKYAVQQLFAQQQSATQYYQKQLPGLLNAAAAQEKKETHEKSSSITAAASSNGNDEETTVLIVPSSATPTIFVTPLQQWLHELQLLSYEPYFLELGFQMLEDFQELNDEDCYLYFPFLKVGDMRRIKKNINDLDDAKIAYYKKKVQKMNNPKKGSVKQSRKTAPIMTAIETN